MIGGSQAQRETFTVVAPARPARSHETPIVATRLWRVNPSHSHTLLDESMDTTVQKHGRSILL